MVVSELQGAVEEVYDGVCVCDGVCDGVCV